MAALNAFEDALVDLAGSHARLVLVITTGGMREFVLYASAEYGFAEFHEALRQQLPSHDVQMLAETDRAWEAYRAFARG